MTLVNQIEQFIPGTIPFAQYLEQLEWVFAHHQVEQDEDKKKAFLAASSREVYTELKKLFPGKDLKKETFVSITTALQKRYDKTDSDMIQRFKFYQRKQRENESAEDFILNVKQQAELCDFGQFKDQAIRDRLVCGLNDEVLRQRLFDEEDLTLTKVEKLIVNRELATVRAKLVSDNDVYRGNVLNRVGDRNRNNRANGAPSFRGRSRSRGRPGGRRERSRSFSAGRRHRSPAATNRKFFCTHCRRPGHTRSYCFDLPENKKAVKFLDEPASTSKNVNRRLVNYREDESDYDEDMNCLMISSIKKLSEPCLRQVYVDGKQLEMEVDCGAAVSVINSVVYEKKFKHIPLMKCDRKLAVINGSRLNVEGQISVEVVFNGIRSNVKLIVLRCSSVFAPLLGRDWLDVFTPRWRDAFGISAGIKQLDVFQDHMVEKFKRKFPNIFDKSLASPIQGFEAELVLKCDTPIFKRAYDVPLRLKDKVIEHLKSLERDGVITPVDASEWASPVIVVIKKDGGIRMVIDCKVSINKVIIPNTYPLPLVQDIFASLAGAKVFCSLDLAGAYTQLLLSKKSREIMVINTIIGLFVYNRLPQGASSSAAIFQRIMEKVLFNIDGVYCYLDDVLIAGKDKEDCVCKLELVLERLSNANIKVNLQKCKWFVNSLPFLGHVLTDNGLMPSPDRVETIRRAKIPNNVSELKAFLGLINYYGKFIPNLSTRLSCLYRLLKKEVRFVWSSECNRAFEHCKQSLLNSKLLEFFDPSKPVIVVTDACSYGLGGVIAHQINGEERPVCFTSFSLNNAQKSYPILHLEALAVVSTIKKFHKYLFGKKFTVFTDHKPLIGIFGREGRNSLFVTRLQRYVLELSIYEFDIVYRPSAKMGNADFCSRFPLPEEVPAALQREYIKCLNITNEFPLDFALIARETKKDKFLQQVVYFMKNGWPDKLDRNFRDVYAQHQDLEEVEGCLLYQDRVCIPVCLQKRILSLLHKNHSGITKIKQLARRTVYWFGMNHDIECFVKSCNICCEMNAVSKPVPHSPWIPTKKPFARIHADFFYFDKKVFLVIVDSFSKWLEVYYMKFGTDARNVKSKFMSFFASFGLPDVVVTDGGPPFHSREFVDFLERNNIRVMKSPPYNPSSNGQAERMVRVVKEGLKKFMLDPEMKGMNIEDVVSFFLFNYRNTCLDNGSFPSERLFNFKPKTLLDLLNPRSSFKKNLTTNEKAESVPVAPVKRDEIDNLRPGDLVYFKNFKSTEIRRWLEAKFLRRISSYTFQVSVGGRVYLAHRNQIKVARGGYTRGGLLVASRYERMQNRKRSREEEEDDADDEFYGFVSDSFVFHEPMDVDQEGSREFDPQEGSSRSIRCPENLRSEGQQDHSEFNPRRSSRLKKARKDSRFVYF